jgi:putative transposase
MARLPRLTLAGYPHHVIQRGNNRHSIFAGDADYRRMLDLLRDNAARFGVTVHSYVLMGNHFHLLVTPQTADALPQMMQSVGRSYVRYFNDLHGRTGTLWEGRYKSTVIQTQRYLLACMAYIDLNPVRADLSNDVADYDWSSYKHYIGRKIDKLVTPHPLYWELGNTPFAREAAYADLVHAGLSGQQLTQLTDATLKGWALGDAEFVEDLQKLTPRRITPSAAGRPPSVSKN